MLTLSDGLGPINEIMDLLCFKLITDHVALFYYIVKVYLSTKAKPTKIMKNGVGDGGGQLSRDGKGYLINRVDTDNSGYGAMVSHLQCDHRVYDQQCPQVLLKVLPHHNHGLLPPSHLFRA